MAPGLAAGANPPEKQNHLPWGLQKRRHIAHQCDEKLARIDAFRHGHGVRCIKDNEVDIGRIVQLAPPCLPMASTINPAWDTCANFPSATASPINQSNEAETQISASRVRQPVTAATSQMPERSASADTALFCCAHGARSPSPHRAICTRRRRRAGHLKIVGMRLSRIFAQGVTTSG